MKNINGIGKLIKALKYSINGLYLAITTERAFIQEAIFSVILLIVIAIIDINTNYKLWLISGIFILLITELLNTAIEAVTDLCTHEVHPLAKRAKDIASGAVLIAIIYNVIIWYIVVF